MNDDNRTVSSDGGAGRMDEVGRLVRFAGEREHVDGERLEVARARVAAHWQDVTLERKRRRTHTRWRQFGIAAGLVATVGMAFSLWERPNLPTTDRLVVVERVTGEARLDDRPLAVGQVFTVGSVLETSVDGRLALEFPDGQSVRVDHASRLVVTANNEVELIAGAVYVDAGAVPNDIQLAVVTQFGVARDIGTQFQVRLNDGGLQVGVREGLVELTPTSASAVEIDHGNLYEVAADGQAFGRRVASNDPLWQWVADISPEFDAEGRTLHEYLEWYAREVGLELRWASTQSERNARDAELSAAIEGLSLEEAFEHVRLIAAFEADVSDGILSITVE